METKSISPACPSCGTKFRTLPAYRIAITIHDRTCRNPKCRERWRMKVEPVRTRLEGMEIRIVELTFLGHQGPLVQESA